MESTALALLALSAKLSCLGVMFGWQPMPEGSNPDGIQKVEYIVQIEPELAETLREGQSIPITSDIPADIGPIGRIRIEVGRGDLPRESLATRFKPWPVEAQKKSREGLVETQFTAPSTAPRYGTTPNNNTILPSGSNQPTSGNPFAQTLQNGVESARNTANNAMNEILPPSGDQLFGSSNDVGQGVQNAISNANNSLRNGMQRGVRRVADSTGQQLRQAVNNVGQRASGAVDEFGRSLTSDRSPLANNQPASSNSTILPPAVNSSAPQSNALQLNQPLQPRREQPQREVPSSSFAGSSPAGTNPTSQPGDFSAPWPSATGQAAPPTTTVNNTPSRYPAQQQPNRVSAPQPNQQQIQQPIRSGFDIADRQTNVPVASGRAYGQQGYPLPNNDMQGPNLAAPIQPQNAVSTVGASRQQRFGPGIRSNALSSGQDNSMMQPAANLPNSQQQRQVAARQPLDAQPRDFGWGQNGQQQLNSGESSSQQFMPIALLCVLLSGSVFSNFYLYWSFSDVRSKYKGVVHGTPSRRDRYDD